MALLHRGESCGLGEGSPRPWLSLLAGPHRFQGPTRPVLLHASPLFAPRAFLEQELTDEPSLRFRTEGTGFELVIRFWVERQQFLHATPRRHVFSTHIQLLGLRPKKKGRDKWTHHGGGMVRLITASKQ